VPFDSHHQYHEGNERKELSEHEYSNAGTTLPVRLPLALVHVCATILDVIVHDEAYSTDTYAAMQERSAANC
jgi:hypothetical protein